MRCQICDIETKNAEYSTVTGKMVSICGECGESIGEIRMDYALEDDENAARYGCDTEEGGW